MKFREHRGSLDESMKTLVLLFDRAALVKHIHDLLYPWNIDVEDRDVKVERYNNGRGDPRIGWGDLYIVTVKDFGVIGWTDEEAA
ncbi:unnamed protein product [Sphagnum jensenii]